MQKFTKYGVGVASIQYWRWRGQTSKGIPAALRGRAPGLDPRRLPSLPLSLSAPRKEASGLVPVAGASVCRDLSRSFRVFSENPRRLSGCGAEAGLAAQAEVIEMNGQPGSAPGPAAGLWEFHLTGVGFGAHTLQMGLVTSRVPAHKLN